MFSADQQSGGSRWPIVRVQIGGETRVTLLSEAWLPLTVHWVGKSIPCCGDGCSLCCWLPGRGLFYLAVMCQNRVSILELASLSFSHLEQHCRLLHGGVRPGLVLRLGRRTAKAPIYSEVVEEVKVSSSVSLLDLAARTMAIYHLPGPNVGEEIVEYSGRIAIITRRRTEIESMHLANAKSKDVAGR